MPSYPSSLSLGTLSQLAALTGVSVPAERAKTALQHFAEDPDPLSRLVATAAEVGIAVAPVRHSLGELLWLARSDSPVLIWSQPQGRWITITAAGWFNLRIADGDHPTARITISRSELLQRLGLESLETVLEAGVVHPERPAQALATEHPNPLAPHGDAGHHGDSHEHPSPARRFLELLKTERQHVGSLLVFSFFSGLLYLAAPLAVDAVVSNLGFGGQSAPYVQALVILTIALMGCLALQAVVSAFQYYLSEIIQRRIFVRASADLAYRLPRVRAEAVDKVHAPELVNRFLEVVTAQKSTSMILLDGVNVVFGSLSGMLLLAFYHPALLALVAILLVLIVVVVWPLGRNAVQTSIAESKLKYELVNWFEQIAAFPLLFRGPGGHALAADRASQLAGAYLEKRGSHFQVVIRQVTGLLVLSVSASGAVLLLGGWLVLNQQLTVGQLAASELIMGGIAASLAKLGKKLEAWYDAMAAMDKLGHLLDLPIEREDGERPPAPVSGAASVEACNLSFAYEGQAPLFSNLSFSLSPGSRTALVGPHGSGASSLLDLLFGIRPATAGHLAIDRLDLRNWYLEGLRENVQLLRRGEIVEGTVLENLKLGRETLGTDECYAALSRVGLLDHLLHRPEGLNLRLRSGGAPLSTTQCTQLLLARAIVQKPRLLLIDELLDGLDPASFDTLSKAVLDPELPWTLVISSREPEIQRLCQQVIPLTPPTDNPPARNH